MSLIPKKQQWKRWALPSKYAAISLIIGLVSVGIYFIPFNQLFFKSHNSKSSINDVGVSVKPESLGIKKAQSHSGNLKKINNRSPKTNIVTSTSGPYSPAITNTGSNSEVNVVYNLNKSEVDKFTPCYELYYQLMKDPPDTSRADNYYEIGFKNITEAPLINFMFVLYFKEPIDGIKYEFSRSSANMTGGQGLSNDRKSFHWMGNQIMEDGGWVVFIIETKTPPPIITRICTKYTGIVVPEQRIIYPDKEGITGFVK